MAEIEDESVSSFLQDFAFPYPETENPNELDDALEEIEQACFDFLQILGYESNNIFQDVTLELSAPQVHQDSLPDEAEFNYTVGRSPASMPYVVADAYLGAETEVHSHYGGIRPSGLVAEYIKYFRAVDSHFFLVFSNSFLVIAKPDGQLSVWVYDDLSESDAKDIQRILEPPDTFPQGPVPPAAFHPNQTKLYEYEIPPYPSTPRSERIIDEENFHLDLADYSKALRKADKANSANEKGTSLENIAKLLFESVTCVTVRDTNVVTRSGEIDLIIEYTGSEKLTLFDSYSRFLLIECKNWIDPVPAKEVGHFETKLAKSDVDLGLLFAWSGISGEDRVEHARRILDTTSGKRPKIIVFDERDLYRIVKGESFYEMIDSKLYRRRFDI